MAVGCWCCGQECMWCDPENPADCGELHWCAECKIAGCEWCCGCSECTRLHRGGWSPEGIQIRHDGARDRITRRDLPLPGDTLRTPGSTPVSDGTVPDPGQP